MNKCFKVIHSCINLINEVSFMFLHNIGLELKLPIFIVIHKEN